jgi:hypothetical protein
MATARHVTLAELTDDLAEITGRIVWSTVSTTDQHGRPRARIMHPVWQISAEHVTGWIGTRRTPVKVAHLARSPWLTCAYWSPEHDAAFIDCGAEWAGPEAWDRIAQGYDPAALWPGGPDSPDFAALRLTPYRIQIIRGADVAAGLPTPLWAAS